VKITDIKTAVIKGNFEWIIVKIYTDEGITGIGEAYWGAGVKEIIHHLKGILVGQDPFNVDFLFQRMMYRMSGAGSIAGATVTAISGVEIALWDVVGKALNTPVYNLFGGKFRDKIRIYADCGVEDDPRVCADKAQEVKAMGYTALKFDTYVPAVYQLDTHNRCLSTGAIRHIAKTVEALRQAVGEEIDLCLDCHWQYSTKDAIRLANALEEYNLLWLEDPTPPENIDALAKVAAFTNTPICTGENLYTKHGFRDLIQKQAADIVAPDIPKVGGLLESRRIADAADTYYIPMAPHNVSSPIGTMAAAHVCASIPNFLVMEFHSLGIPWWNDLVEGGGPVIKDGYITVPDKPGIGVELNEEVARQHLKGGETLFE